MTKKDDGFEEIGNLFASSNSSPQKKPPAYQWQEMALKIIEELNIPNFKRGSVFKICKEKDKIFVQTCLNDTKELCESKTKWKYFFKLIGGAK